MPNGCGKEMSVLNTIGKFCMNLSMNGSKNRKICKRYLLQMITVRLFHCFPFPVYSLPDGFNSLRCILKILFIIMYVYRHYL